MFRQVGMIGVGVMGQALLHRLKLAGLNVKVYDISDVQCNEARKLGADVERSPAAASRNVEAVHIFVRTDEEALSACTASGGVLSAIAEGSIVFLHSTILPETTRKIAEMASLHGVQVIDAPVTAVPSHVREGNAVFLLGGSVELVEFVRPYLLMLGKSVYHFGPLGAGNVAKIAKNLATAIERMSAAEVVWLAEAGELILRLFSR